MSTRERSLREGGSNSDPGQSRYKYLARRAYLMNFLVTDKLRREMHD